MANKRIGLFYLSLTPTKNGQEIHLYDGVSVWIRVEEFIGADLEEALGYAFPRFGETVMNTHYLEEEHDCI